MIFFFFLSVVFRSHSIFNTYWISNNSLFFLLCIEHKLKHLFMHCDYVHKEIKTLFLIKPKIMNSMIYIKAGSSFYTLYFLMQQTLWFLCVFCRHNSTFHFNQMNKFQLMLTASNDTDENWYIEIWASCDVIHSDTVICLRRFSTGFLKYQMERKDAIFMFS